MYLIYKGINSDGSHNYLTFADGEISFESREKCIQFLIESGVLVGELNQYEFEKV